MRELTDQEVIKEVQDQIEFAKNVSDGDAELTEIEVELLQRLINMAVPTIRTE